MLAQMPRRTYTRVCPRCGGVAPASHFVAVNPFLPCWRNGGDAVHRCPSCGFLTESTRFRLTAINI